MEIEYIEMDLRKEIDEIDFKNDLAIFLNISVNSIVKFDKYLNDLTLDQQKKVIEIDFQNNSNLTFKTIVRGSCYFKFNELYIKPFSHFLANKYQTDIVIGDFWYPDPSVQDRLLLICPDGSEYKAIDSATPDNNDIEIDDD